MECPSPALALLFALVLLGAAPGAETYYVSSAGSDAAAGTSPEAAFATLQHAAGVVAPGDTVIVLPGTHAGFYLATSGSPGAPITFRADPRGGAPHPLVVLSGANPFTPDTVNLEGASHVVIEGFTILGTPDPAVHRAGIRAVGTAAQHASHVVVRGCRVDRCGRWGIFTGFVDDLLVEGCETSRSADEHGIYVSNSGDRPVLRDNVVWGNHSNGIHMNGDASLGGDGVISDAVVERNVIHGNGDGDPAFGPPGGSAINCDGVVAAVIQNNLLFDNHKSGISLYRIDGGAPSTGNRVTHNTVVNAAPSRWCLNVKDGSTGNTVRNNVFYNEDPLRGSIDIESSCLPGFTCDYNALEDRFSLDDVWIDFAQWQAATGQDAHSFLADPAALFADPGQLDYRLKPGSPALDAGTADQAPDHDLVLAPRPTGPGFDVGAYELQVCGSFTPYGAGLAGTGGFEPALSGAGCPAPGAAVTLSVTGGLGGAPGVLLAGVSPASTPLLGGTLLAVPAAVLPHALGGAPGAAGQGTALFPVTLAPEPSSVGATVYLQVGYADPGAAFGASLSAGLALAIGG